MRIGVVAVVVSLSLAGLSFAADAEAAMRRSTNIPAQPLASALQALASEHDFQIVFVSEEVRDRRTHGAQGELTPQEALVQLLGGTGLTFKYLDERTVTVEPAPSAQRAVASAEGGTIEATRSGTPANGAAPSEAVMTPVRENAEVRDVGAISEVLVKGSRLLNTDIKRSEDDIQPYVVFDRKVIEKSGARNAEEFLKHHLTSMNNGTTPSAFPSSGGVSAIDLRGLGTDETLILVDGRRMASYSVAGFARQPDLNSIPTAAIERIDVLPVTASGIYGGGATGGVVNIVLRRDYTGVEATLVHEDTYDGGGASNRVTLTAGFNVEGGKTNILLAGTYSDTDPLQVGDRELAQRGRSHILATNPAAILSNPIPPLGATTNIRSTSGANLTLKPAFGGGALGSPTTSIPIGYGGPASDSGAALIANAGQYNLDLADTAQRAGGNLFGLWNAATVESFAITVRRQFSPNLQVFLEGSAAENSGEFVSNPTTGVFILPAASPANPFNQQIRVNTPVFGADGINVQEVDNRRAVGGIILALPKDWQLALDHSWGRARFFSSEPSFSLIPAATSDVRSGVLNVFRDTSAFATDFSPYVLEPSTAGPGESTQNDTALRMAGPLPWSLPGGPITLSAVLERRKESFDDFRARSQFIGAGVEEESSIAFSRHQTVNSAYLEAGVPLVSENNDVPGIRRLDLQFAVRYDDYDIAGANQSFSTAPQPETRVTNHMTSTDPTFGLRYQPLPDLTFRASVQTGFNPPSIGELAPGESFELGLLDLDGLTDPRRGDEPLGLIGPVTLLTGGNPELLPEESESWSAGLIITPRFAPRLRVSLDWTEIDKTDNATSFPIFQPFIDEELRLPGVIERAAPLNDGFAVGPITSFSTRPINIAHQRVEAFDLSLDYGVDIGRFGELRFASDATRNIRNETQIFEAQPVEDRVGLSSNLKWKANGSLTWERGRLSVEWMARYFDSYFINVAHTVPANQGSATIPSQLYHDVLIRYAVDADAESAWLANTEIQVGAKNVFNERSPVDVAGATGSYSVWADPRQGTYWLSLRKGFGR